MAIPTTVAQAQTRGWWLVNPTEEELMYGTFTKAMLEHRPVPVRVFANAYWLLQKSLAL